jgi:hypothetical protein
MKLAFFMLFINCSLMANGESTNSLTTVLDVRNHIENGATSIVFGSSDEINKKRILYQKQLAAIKAIGESKSSGSAVLLIPYLDYAISWGETGRGQPRKKMDIDRIKKVWPAFASLMEIPDSQKVLLAYIEDPRNPLDDRLTALVALRYKDTTTFKNVSQSLLNEYKTDSELSDYLIKIQQGKIEFWGHVGWTDRKSYLNKTVFLE